MKGSITNPRPIQCAGHTETSLYDVKEWIHPSMYRKRHLIIGHSPSGKAQDFDSCIFMGSNPICPVSIIRFLISRINKSAIAYENPHYIFSV